MKRVHAVVAGIGCLATVCGVLGYSVGRARADGIAATTPMYYSGYLEDAGRPVEGVREITLRVFGAETGGAPVCPETRVGPMVTAGHFRIPLDNRCTAEVQRTPDLWLEILVGGQAFARTKIGAVPYAIEAGRAAAASGELETRIRRLESAPGAASMPSAQVVFDSSPVSVQRSPEGALLGGPTISFTPSESGSYEVIGYASVGPANTSTGTSSSQTDLTFVLSIGSSPSLPSADVFSMPDGIQQIPGYFTSGSSRPLVISSAFATPRAIVRLNAGTSYQFYLSPDLMAQAAQLRRAGILMRRL